ncbi:hypothetical protein L218DRAFT_4106 [Marasmius fiardii PR-910]|nr:hypothetical protein L218DRAFT_4106 [Marasmius fiardii PR-910]
MVVTVVKLKNPNVDRLQDLAELCCKAYDHEDPALKSLMGGNLGLSRASFLATIGAAALGGHLFVALEGDEKDPVGVAVWWGPGERPFANEEQRRAGFYVFWNALSPAGKQWHQETIYTFFGNCKYQPELEKLATDNLGSNGKLNSWWLNLIAVDPAYQRRGIARQLIETIKADAGDVEIALCATTQQNASVYHILGFVLRGSTTMTGPWGEFPVFLFSSMHVPTTRSQHLTREIDR